MTGQRLIITLICALAGSFELWLFGQSLGHLIVGGVALGLAYILCSPRAKNLTGLLKIAALLLVAALAIDGLGALITKAIDGEASVGSNTWLVAATLVWFFVHHTVVGSQWVGVSPGKEDHAHG